MASKPETQQFTQSWNKTVNWAKQNNIPYSAYYPVYQLDSQRFITTGSPYSETERIKAIEAAAGLNYSNALPTDNPNWSAFRTNSLNNANQIFTGLEPTHLIGNIVDTIGHIFSDPTQLAAPIGDLLSGNTGAAARQVLKPNNVWSWVPGAYDLATVFAADPHLTGNKGAEALAHEPITAVLDILPFGRVLSEGLGRGAAVAGQDEALASRIGMTPAELRQQGIWRVGGKLIKSIPVTSKLTRETHPWLENLGKNPATGEGTPNLYGNNPTGNPSLDLARKLYVGDFWSMLRQKVQAGSEQADIVENRLKENDEGTAEVARIAGPAMEVLNKLNPAQRDALNTWARKDSRPLEDKLADTQVPRVLRNAYKAAYDLGMTLQEMKMQAGMVLPVKQPFNDVDAAGNLIHNPEKPDLYESYTVDSTKYRVLTQALQRATDDATARDDAAKPITIALFKMDENDRNMSGVFDALHQAINQVYATIKQSVPPGTVANRLTGRLRGDFPQDERWEQTAVDQQTPTLRNLLGFDRPTQLPDGSVITKSFTMHDMNAVRDLFAPGGLIDKMVEAYQSEDWVSLNKYSKAAVRKFNNKTFKDIPKNGRAQLYIIKRMTENVQKYAAERQRLSEEVLKRVEGKYRGAKMGKTGYKKSMAYLSVQASKSQDAWLKAAIQNPPDIWRNVGVDMVAQRLAQEEKTAAAIDGAAKTLSKQGWSESELTKTMQNPRTMQELMTNDAKASLENAMLPDIDHAESNKVTQDMYDELASLRARGHQPLYVHMLTPSQLEHATPDYNVYIRGLKERKIGSNYESVWGYTPTVYDIGAGLLEETKNVVEHDMMQKFIDQELRPRLYNSAEIQPLIRTYFKNEIAEMAGDPSENALSVINRGLDKWNLVEYNPRAIFGDGFATPTLNGTYYIHKDLAKAFSNTIQKFQFPAQSIIDRGTKLFRFSILSLSPRYTAHILLGGSFLVALRGHATMLKYFGNALYFATHGSFSESALQKFPDEFAPYMQKAALAMSPHAMAPEEGIAAAQYQYTRGASAHFTRNTLLPEKLHTMGLPDTYRNRLVAAANLNTSFTRAITSMQKSMVYLDGAARALKDGTSFYEDRLVPRQPVSEGAAIDSQGRPVLHPLTNRTIHDVERQQMPMSPAQAHKQGMEAVAETMGNLRHMTPLERGVLTRIFPFYGWTKHILQYVMSYPFDHPWRAMILSQIATQNSQDIASGLPMRIQLLTMLGSPDQFGNVTAIDTKSLDPLRDTANYASLVGVFESLNPAITGAIGLVDPQISFAGQSLYPTVSFNSLYGDSTAGAGGNLYTAAEQFVPQLTAVDAAFNLSGQYAYLSQGDPGAFSKKIFESLGLPLTPEQINLRQIAAKSEIDRYQEASAAAKSAAQGDESALAGYGANTPVPDPLNPLYNVTPAYIAAMNQQSEDTTGLPWYDTATPPPSPAL